MVEKEQNPNSETRHLFRHVTSRGVLKRRVHSVTDAYALSM